MNKEKLIRVLECMLLKFDNVTDGKLLLEYGFSYDEIETSRKMMKVWRDFQ